MRKPIYKPYNQEQGMLTFTYDHLIPANHIVRTVNELIDGKGLAQCLAHTKGSKILW